MTALLLVAFLGAADPITRECASETAQALANALNRSYEQALVETLPDDPVLRVKIQQAALAHFATIEIKKPPCVTENR